MYNNITSFEEIAPTDCKSLKIHALVVSQVLNLAIRSSQWVGIRHAPCSNTPARFPLLSCNDLPVSDLSFAEKLQGSKFGEDEDVKAMTKIFDETAKLRFSNPSEPSYIKFGTVRDKDPAFNIRSGQLKLPG